MSGGPARHDGSAAPPSVADQILSLQQTVGNRAVARMLGAPASVPRRLVARKTTVSEYVKEETDTADNITGTASFDVDFDEDAMTCWASVRIRLNVDSGISSDDIAWTKIGVISRFSLLWDSRFSFHEHRTFLPDRDWLFRPRIDFVTSGEHEAVALHPGKGQSNKRTWYLMKGEINADNPAKSVPQGYAEVEHAHEVSHQLGLLDEYEDVHVKARQVYTDHSLMGDYANEGYDKVTLHPRHGDRLAKIIGRATDKTLTSAMVRTN